MPRRPSWTAVWRLAVPATSAPSSPPPSSRVPWGSSAVPSSPGRSSHITRLRSMVESGSGFPSFFLRGSRTHTQPDKRCFSFRSTLSVHHYFTLETVKNTDDVVPFSGISKDFGLCYFKGKLCLKHLPQTHSHGGLIFFSLTVS
uniref:(northern house mosquito) hypothetical protein n=1 Tax=Culex pipiens TaxID=7175 RepID=A0A8D7ZZK4_CULPI